MENRMEEKTYPHSDREAMDSFLLEKGLIDGAIVTTDYSGEEHRDWTLFDVLPSGMVVLGRDDVRGFQSVVVSQSDLHS